MGKAEEDKKYAKEESRKENLKTEGERTRYAKYGFWSLCYAGTEGGDDLLQALNLRTTGL